MFTIHILIVWTLKHFSFRVMISRSKNNIIITAIICIFLRVLYLFIIFSFIFSISNSLPIKTSNKNAFSWIQNILKKKKCQQNINNLLKVKNKYLMIKVRLLLFLLIFTKNKAQVAAYLTYAQHLATIPRYYL